MNFSDDVIVYGKTQAEHHAALEQVFHRFSKKGLTLNQDKCEFSKSEITFLDLFSQLVAFSQIREKFMLLRPRQPQRHMLAYAVFLVWQHSSKFVKNFSDLTQPLRELTKKDTVFCWLDCHKQAFNVVKSALIRSPVMSYFDKTKHTDLLLTDAWTVCHVISMWSRSERSYLCCIH